MIFFQIIDFRTTFLAVIGVINVVLASLIYLQSKEKSSKYFVIAISGVAIWSFGIMFYTLPEYSQDLTRLYSNINYSITAVLAVSFYFFARYFSSENEIISKKFKIFTVLALVTVIFFVQIPILDWAVVKNIDVVQGKKIETFGYGYPTFVSLLLYYFIAGIFVLFKKFLNARKNLKLHSSLAKQLIFIILGTSFSITIGIVANVILPNMNVVGYYWVGPIGTLIMVLLISYAITRHKLWNFRLIAIEISIILLILTILLQVIAAESTLERLIKIIIFLTVSFSSFYVIKNLLEEVHARERLEQLAEDLAHANRRLQMIDQEKSDFVSITSHQFRTPLTVIGGYTSMLLEGSFNPIRNKTQREVLDKIFQASKRLVFTIEEFLNISRLERNEMHYRFEKVDIKVLTSSVISIFQDIIKQEKIYFTFNLKDADSFLVYIDPEKTKTVIGNILDNAIKYTPGGGSIKLVLSKDKKNGSIFIAISDTGIGVPLEMIPKLFEKFSRAPGVSKLHTEGRGLGLYVARKIMRAQKGDIGVESKGIGMGSTFILRFSAYEFIEKQKEIKSFVEDL